MLGKKEVLGVRIVRVNLRHLEKLSALTDVHEWRLGKARVRCLRAVVGRFPRSPRERLLPILPLVAMALRALGLPVVEIHARFAQEVPRTYTQADGLPSNDIRHSVALADGRVVAADAGGRLALFQHGSWSMLAGGADFPVRMLCGAGEQLWVIGARRAAVLRGSKWTTLPFLLLDDARAAAVWNGTLLVAGGTRLWQVAEAGVRELPWEHGRINALAATDKVPIAAGTDEGLYFAEAAGKSLDFRRVYPANRSYSWSLRRVTVLVAEAERLWFGAENGAGVFDGRD